MEKHKVKILEIEQLTPTVKRFIVEKPEGYNYNSGQYTIISINKPGMDNKKRPFSFSSSNEDPKLEFIIREYPEHKGISKEIHRLKPGDELIIGRAIGKIKYKGEGIFIAAGTGIVPFISIFKSLKKENKIENNRLIFTNRIKDEIILEDELRELLMENVSFVLTREEREGYIHGRIDEEFLKNCIKNFNQTFCICGPINFVKEIREALKNLGVNEDSIVFEGK